MKKYMKLISLLVTCSSFVLVGCNKKDGANQKGPGESKVDFEDDDFTVTYKADTFEEYKKSNNITVYTGDATAVLLTNLLDSKAKNISFKFSTTDSSVCDINENSGKLNAKKAGSTTLKAQVLQNGNVDPDKYYDFSLTVEDSAKIKGAYSYTNESYDEKSRILASLEKYAVDNYLTGITMFSNDSKICYNSRYTPTPKNYVSGYGWGTFREGEIKDNASIKNPLHGVPGTYYQTGTTQLPDHANAMASSGSVVSDLYDRIATKYYSTRLNETNDGYEWYPETALDENPIPLDSDGNPVTSNVSSGTFNKWRIHVRTGSGFVYRTSSTKTKGDTNLATFNDRPVVIDDYLTPIKFLLTCYNGQFRGAELTTGTSAFSEEAADYYSRTVTKPSTNEIYDSAAWAAAHMDNCIKTGHDSATNTDYIDFKLLYPCTQFFAKYYLSSSLFSPLPEDFVKLWGGDNLGKSPTGYTPSDTMLSTGPYMLDKWDTQYITYSKNDKFFITKDTFEDGTERKLYQIAGLAQHLFDDASALKSNFENGSIDAYAPTKEDLKANYGQTEGTTSNGVSWKRYDTKGDSNFKLNVNSTTSEQWDDKFGASGKVHAHTSSEISSLANIKKTREILSDKNFLDFLSFGMDRPSICQARGQNPTQEYFSDNYLIDPEKGVSYNSTPAHRAVLADRSNSTYGYDPDRAKASLKKFLDEKVGSGDGQGQSEDKIVLDLVNGKRQLKIKMNWMNPTDSKDYNDVFDSIKNIFNELCKKEHPNFELVIDESETPTNDYQVVYDKMKQGEYDLGFGSISGYALDPLNFMEVLKSDNSSSFTLNWGPDTDKINNDDRSNIVYDGKQWSFDALFNAANTGVLLDENANMCNVKVTKKSTDSVNKTITYGLDFSELIGAGANPNATTIKITNSRSILRKSITDLGATSDNGYKCDLTLGSEFNSYEDFKIKDGHATTEKETIYTPNPQATVSYEVEIDGVNKTLSSNFNLKSFYGEEGY